VSIPLFFHHQSDMWELNHKVSFDGPNKLILINTAVTGVDVKVELYSDWKEWAQQRTNLKYEAALRTVGGDPTIDSTFLGSTFFLINDWKLKTWEGDHELIINGNLFVDGGGSTFVPTDDPHNIQITSQRSNLVDLLVVSASGGSSGSFSDTDRVSLQQIESVVNNLPDSGTLSALVGEVSDIRFATFMRSSSVLSASLSQVVTTIDAADGTFENMFVVVTSGSNSVSRKIETQLSGGLLVFDEDLPFIPDSGSNVAVLPGYDPVNGRMG
jgi:hypothetical protein